MAVGRFVSTQYSTWISWDEENRLAYSAFNPGEEKRNEGYVIKTFVSVDAGNGFLSSNEDVSTGYFINIIETMETRDGTELTQVHNSMRHHEEIYTWKQFQKSWKDAGPNDSGQAVLARPPDVVP